MDSIVDNSSETGFGLENLPWGVFSKKGSHEARCGVALGDHVVDVRALCEAGFLDGSELARSDCFTKGELNGFMALGQPAWREARQGELNGFIALGQPAWREARQVLQRILSRKEGAFGELNGFMALGQPAWREARQVLQRILSRKEGAFGELNGFMALGQPAWREARHVLQRILSRKEGALRDNTALMQAAVLDASSVDMLLPCRVGDYTDFYASKQHASNAPMSIAQGDKSCHLERHNLNTAATRK
eukprot:gene28731-31908_t